MSFRPFRNIGRLALAACAVSFTIASAGAQSTLPNAPNPSRVDVFAGYSYFGTHSVLQPSGLQFSSVNEGAMGSVAYYFNRYFGGEVAVMAGPPGENDGFFGYYAGPIFRLPMQGYTLFAHGLAGGVDGVGVNSPGYFSPSSAGYNPYTWGVGLVAGGGMDYDLPFFNHHLGIRLFEADYRYIHDDFGPAEPGIYRLGGRANIDGAELSSGLLFKFGSIVPPPPVTYACAVTAPTGAIYPGDPVTITGTATNLRPKKDAHYTWTSDGGTVSGESNVAAVDTKTLSAGTYTVKGHIEQGKKPGEFADCSAPFTITAFQPPTISCSANPSTLNAGDPSTITASGVSPQSRPLTYSYSATAGTISGSTATTTLSTTGAAPGTTITVTCNVVDDKGQTASSQATVTLNAPPPPPAPVTQSLCTITFNKDKARPTRVDNEAKACLDDIALTAQRDTTAKLAIVGNSEPGKVAGKHTPLKEKHAAEWADKRAAERAVNEKEYLVKEKGLDASSISVYTGTAGTNSDATTLIPAGATLDQTGLTPVDEGKVKAVPRKAVAHHHHKAAEAK